MAITYNAGTNVITVTGYTAGAPCRFLDVWNADQAGGWGVITRQCSHQYCLSAQLDIGDGSTVTYFGDKNVWITISDFTPNSSWFYIRILVNATATFGELISGKQTRHGCTFDLLTTTNLYPNIIGNSAGNEGNLNLYSCILNGRKTSYVDTYISGFLNLKVYNSIFNRCHLSSVTTSLDIYNLYITTVKLAVAFITAPTTTYELLTINNVSEYDAFYFDAASGISTIKNSVFEDCSYDFCMRGSGANLYAVNVVSNWHIRDLTWGTALLYRQYEFDLKIIDKDENGISSTVVKIWDKDNNLVVDTTTNASGIIATQTLNYGYYNQAGGDTPVMQTPHTIQISKVGYETYKKKWTLDKKTDWTIALHIPKRRFDSLEG